MAVVANREGIVSESFELLLHVEVVALQLEVEPAVYFTDHFIEGQLFLEEGRVGEGGGSLDTQLEILDLLEELFAQFVLLHLEGQFVLVFLGVHSV